MLDIIVEGGACSASRYGTSSAKTMWFSRGSGFAILLQFFVFSSFSFRWTVPLISVELQVQQQHIICIYKKEITII
jgi:hypothetical protein